MVFAGVAFFAALLASTTFAAPFVNTSSDAIVLVSRDGPGTSLGLGNSQWIWTGENAGNGGAAPISTRAFRKTFNAPYGKCPVCATVLLAADNGYTLYVNGAPVGTGGDFRSAQVCTAALKSEQPNVFAVSATNTGGPAGIIATILIEYTDGTSDKIVTDTTWKTFVGPVPAGFQNPSFDDSAWTASVAQGADGVAPWGLTTIPPALDVSQTQWIWTSELSGGNAPIATRPFRKTITSPYGKCAVCAKVVISVDNGYTLYANGAAIGSGGNFGAAQYYSITDLNSESNVFAVDAANTGGPAGVIATILVAYSDGTSELFRTDTTWKNLHQPSPAGFAAPNIDDSTWQSSVTEGAYGVAPWGAITIPSA